MNSEKSIKHLVMVCGLLISTASMAGQVGSINTFSTGTPAVAAEVNANFMEHTTQINDNDSRVSALEALLVTVQSILSSQAATITSLETDLAAANTTISALQSELSSVQNSNVMDLDPYVTVASDSRGPIVTMSGLNFQIVNGVNHPGSINGLGNLIIGYDGINTGSTHVCSSGNYTDQTTCESMGSTWSNSHKTGSHYLVVGHQNSYSSYGGIVAGQENFAIDPLATVTGGRNNIASGDWSNVSGGFSNIAWGLYSSVNGGELNLANGLYSSVSGGISNIASGTNSSVSGGRENTASGTNSSVTGGWRNEASYTDTSISGGYSNTASGLHSSVSGGASRSVTGSDDWAAGSLFENN